MWMCIVKLTEEITKMIYPICKTRFADYPEEDYILDLPAPPGKGIIAKSEEAHERRMKVFCSDEERFCSDECSEIFLEECEGKQREQDLGFDRRMKEGWR